MTQQDTQSQPHVPPAEFGPPLPEFARKKPSEYSDDERHALVLWICETIAEGGEGNTVKKAAARVGLTRGTLFRWTSQDKELGKLFESSRIFQTHSMIEDTVELADSAVGGKTGNVDKVRLQVDTRKFYIIKVAPRIYGDALQLSGPGGIPLAPPAPTRFDASKLSLEELEQLEALHAKATVLNVVEAVVESDGLALPSGSAGLEVRPIPANTGGLNGRP